MTTVGLLLLCIGNSSLGATVMERLHATLVLHKILVTILEPESISGLLDVCSHVGVGDQSLCEKFNVDRGTCDHIHSLLQSFAAYPMSQARIAQGLVVAFPAIPHCTCVKKWMLLTLQTMSPLIDARVSELGWDEDCMAIRQLHSGNRKRRLDQDTCSAAIVRTATLGKAPTIGALGSATGALHESAGRDIIERRLEASLTDAWRQAQSTGLRSISMCMDAKKLGQPLEETLAFACYDCASGRAYIPPPQVWLMATRCTHFPLSSLTRGSPQ